MPNKEIIIHYLLRHDWISGSELAEKLSISRTAVWNHISYFRQKGYIIDSHPKSGYRLLNIPDSLYPELIRFDLNTRIIGNKIIHFPVTGSTNDDLLNLGAQGYPEGTVVIAEQQTKGKGRYNRKWESTYNKSILFSLLLRPDNIKLMDCYQFTILSSVCIVETLFDLTESQFSIKWPNDIYSQGKKIAGILTELRGEMELINYIVVGIGINLNQDTTDFPDNLPSAGSVYLSTGIMLDRFQYIKCLLKKIDHYYFYMKNNGFTDIFEKWKTYCDTNGKRVTFSSGNISGSGIVLDINSDGALIIQDDNNMKFTIYSGDISII